MLVVLQRAASLIEEVRKSAIYDKPEMENWTRIYVAKLTEVESEVTLDSWFGLHFVFIWITMLNKESWLKHPCKRKWFFFRLIVIEWLKQLCIIWSTSLNMLATGQCDEPCVSEKNLWHAIVIGVRYTCAYEYWNLVPFSNTVPVRFGLPNIFILNPRPSNNHVRAVAVHQ